MLALHLRHDASDGGTVGSALHERLVREAQTLRGLLECPSDVRLPAAAERDAFFEHGSDPANWESGFPLRLQAPRLQPF